jgi:NTE family protein
LLFNFPGHAYSDEDQAPADLTTRPKIGLVLSGGGARGAAHVGVLRVLEENRIPIDTISGTSFGAIVGGLYG